MRKSGVSIMYKVSYVFLKSRALDIYQLTISEKDVKTLCQIFEYVVKHRRQRLESFTVKDLIFYANKDDLRGDILVSIHLDKSTNDILSAASYRLAERPGRVLSNIEMHRPAFSAITGNANTTPHAI